MKLNVVPPRTGFLWVRMGIRRLLAQRIREETARYNREAYVADLKARPIAEHTRAANEQHYEVPTAFYQKCLGRRLKYSGCLYPTGRESLGQAEDAMLALYAERGELADGQDIHELGCGWGSLTLWMAERYPNARITAVSNSTPQRQFIEAQCLQRGFGNVRVLTCDVNRLELPAGAFDRCVSVEP